MENLGYYNGKYDLIENMQIPMNDRAVFFGDGIYEAIYTRNYITYALDEHIDRLFESAAALDLFLPFSKKELSDIINNLVQKVDSDEQLVYFQVSRGTQLRSHAPSKELKANLLITCRPMKLRDSYTPMKLITVPDTRFFHCNMKTLNLLPTVLASKLADEKGVDEAVFHRDGSVTECAHSNIFIITENYSLKTAPESNMILSGVARAHLIKAAAELKVPIVEEAFSLDEMMSAREIIVTASGTLCRPVCEIDGISTGGRAPAMLSQLRDIVVNDFMQKTSK